MCKKCKYLFFKEDVLPDSWLAKCSYKSEETGSSIQIIEMFEEIHPGRSAPNNDECPFYYTKDMEKCPFFQEQVVH